LLEKAGDSLTPASLGIGTLVTSRKFVRREIAPA
jgi:hypothetical protein